MCGRLKYCLYTYMYRQYRCTGNAAIFGIECTGNVVCRLIYIYIYVRCLCFFILSYIFFEIFVDGFLGILN